MEFVRPLEPILIIDDSVEAREYLCNILEDLGFEEVSGSEDFDSAKNHLEKNPPNLIFLDIELPNTDGSAILDYLNEHYPKSHVIMCSGHNSLECVQNTWECGAKDFIEKPFNAKKVDTVLKRLELVT
tara:strand:+ start:710 stop:1093 length:384 start_codon:yes stop_codon:yes gene_type:complete